MVALGTRSGISDLLLKNLCLYIMAIVCVKSISPAQPCCGMVIIYWLLYNKSRFPMDSWRGNLCNLGKDSVGRNFGNKLDCSLRQYHTMNNCAPNYIYWTICWLEDTVSSRIPCVFCSSLYMYHYLYLLALPSSAMGQVTMVTVRLCERWQGLAEFSWDIVNASVVLEWFLW